MQRHLFLLPAIIGLAGCGLAKYEERLKQTSDYFAYHQLLNDNLSTPAWSGTVLVQGDYVEVGVPRLVSVPVGVSMRIPKGFTRLPGPQEIPDPNDPEIITGYTNEMRDPTHLGAEFYLPGIVEAWEMQAPSGLVRLYVLGNYDKLLQQEINADAVEPAAYFMELEDTLSRWLNVGLVKEEFGSPSDVNVFYRASFPNVAGRDRFQTVKQFDVVSIAPPQQIEGVEWRAMLYEVYKPEDVPVKAAVLCIYPAVEHSNIIENLELALETLTVGDQAPSRPDESGSGGGF